MIYTSSQLREQYTPREISTFVSAHRLQRAGRYYVTPDTATDVRTVLAAGLRPTCLTAAKQHKLWVPPGRGLHAYGRRGTDPKWGRHGWHQTWPEEGPVASPQLMLQHASLCLDPLHVGVLADSALRTGALTQAEIRAVAETAPRRAARVLTRATRVAESGTESKVRLFFQLRGVPVRPQVEIDGVGRVDLVVGRRWIIECDSRAFHTGEKYYESDRARDLRAIELGYLPSRLTYSGIFPRWDETRARLLRIMRSGVHLDPPAKWACR